MTKRILLLVLLVLTSSTVLAQYDHQRKKERSSFGSRDGRFETSILLAYQNSVADSSEGGSSIDVNSSVGWGVSFGWNWTAKLNLSYRLLANKPAYAAVIVPEDPADPPQTLTQKMSKYSHQFNLSYNFMKGSFTPFVVGGIGYTKLDSNIASAPPNTSCWWDPWWGYICVGDWKTFSTSKISYNLGVGLRWEINNAVFTRAAYSREFLSLKNGSVNFDTLSVEVGLMF